MLLHVALALSADPVIHGDTAPAYKILAGTGTAELLLNATNGSPEASLGTLSLADGAEVAPHVHADSVEILYVVEGRAEMVIGGQPWVAEKGDAVRIEKGVEHSARVTGSLRAVQVYVVAGPEQRFTAGERIK
ncbi:MAG: cupin domain-containing protein [Deltaproteobacteria bacterium]|nr:cupin domain-containing protein [Deltaproteobacteria bacterium]